MNNILKLLILFVSLSSCSPNSKYSGTWYNNANYCDSIMISSGENKMVVEYFNLKYPAEEKNGYLEIYDEETLKIALGQKDELLIKGTVFSKQSNEINLNGTWKIFECAEKFEWSGIVVENDTVTISYGAPLEIVGTLKEVSKDTIAITYAYGAGTISMMNIVDGLKEKIVYDDPIAFIIPKSKNHFHFIWKGISIKGQKGKWLNHLDDYIYWGEKAEDFEYNILFAREK